MKNEEHFLDGHTLYEQGQFKQAISAFMLGAENGDVPCMTRIADMYTCGEGVECNYDKAIEWELRAIELGDISAMVNVGISFRMKGAMREAKKWFQKASDGGDGSGALELAKLYMVSDKESGNVKKYLLLAAENKGMCKADLEEARQLLSEL